MTGAGEVVPREAFAFLNQRTKQSWHLSSFFLWNVSMKVEAAATILLPYKKDPEDSTSVGFITLVEPLNPYHQYSISKLLVM